MWLLFIKIPWQKTLRRLLAEIICNFLMGNWDSMTGGAPRMDEVDKSLDTIQNFKAYPVTLVNYCREANRPSLLREGSWHD